MTRRILFIGLLLSTLYSFSHGQPCEITTVSAVALPCQGNDFLVSLDLEVTNPTSAGFTLAGNGVIYGTYLYTDLPLTVGPFLGDDEAVYEFIAWDVENADCQEFTTLPAANCGPICSISDFELDFVTCIGNNSAIVVFDFEHNNPSGLTFDLYNEEGEELGTWLYESLPVTLPFFEVNGAAPIVLTVCDHNDPDCCETFVLDAIDCNTNNCEIFSVMLDPDCNGPNFTVEIDFGYDNPPSDSFSVAGNNLSYGNFAYTQLPVSIGPLNGGTNINWTFSIADTELPSCSVTQVLGIYNCPPPCDVKALEALALECFGNEAYALEIGLDIEGEGDTGFAVFSETGYYGSYMYNELPLVLPAFEGSGQFIDIVSVCDNENIGCCATTPFEALLCAGCLIYNLTATPLPCNEEDEIFVQIDFDHQNSSMEGFEVSGNGNNYGEFAYEDLPIQIGPFVGDGTQYFEFVITDLVNQLCFEAVELGFIDCDTICELTNLVVETGDCTGNNEYVLTLDFDYQGVAGVGFDVYANGENIGFYSYNDLPLTIEGFPASGTGSDMLTVCENDQPLCCASVSFDAPDCACSIFDLTASNLGCNSDTTFGVSVEFFYENLPGDLVEAFFDGVLLGTYDITEIPLTLSLPEGDGTGVLTICANDLNDCCDQFVIERIICETPQCGITELFAEVGDCNSDSTFLLDISFDFMNLPTDSIVVTANGNFIGQYQIQPEFNRIENFPVLTSDMTTVTVCAVGEPDCCASFNIVTPDCSLFGQCQLTELTAQIGDCTSDTTFILSIDFDTINLPTESINVFGNGNLIGAFEITAEGVVIENFPVYESPNTLLTICAVGDPDCCTTIEFETPECEGGGICSISDLIADVGDCTTNETFSLFINYSTLNLPVDSVIVTANGEFIGQYEHNPEGFTIENFPSLEADVTEITVCAVNAPDCCDSFEFITLDCEGSQPCSIADLVADAGACNGDSTFALFINYVAANLPIDSVLVTTDGGYSAQFVHIPGGFTISDFPVYNTTLTTIYVCAVGESECCDVYVLETPDCGQEFICEIENLFAETGECTSDTTYLLDVAFDGYNLPGDSVEIYANDVFVGTFLNDPEFIRIENFPTILSELTILTVCAQGTSDCCASYAFETVFCSDECSIFDIAVTSFDCNSDSTFVLVVDFNAQNLPGGGVDMYAGDEYLGFFGLGQIPAEVNNFPSNETGNYVITICESDGTACCTSFEFSGPSSCGSASCAIFDLAYELTTCDSADNFYFILDFDFTNPGGDGFNIVGNGNEYGNFDYEQLPVQVGPFPSDDTDYEFLVFDAANPECFAVINPGVVECLVSTLPVDFDEFFTLINNGAIPGIYAKKDIMLSLYHANGKNVLVQYPLSADEIYELKNQPAGLYIATIIYGANTWPVKLIKSGN